MTFLRGMFLRLLRQFEFPGRAEARTGSIENDDSLASVLDTFFSMLWH